MSEIVKIIGNLLHITPPETADQENEIWVLDNTAVLRREGEKEEWRAEFVLAAFAANEEWRKALGEGVAELAQIIQLAPGDNATENRIEQRIAPFLRQISPNIVIDIRYDGIVDATDGTTRRDAGDVLHLGPTDGNGIVSREMVIPVTSPPFAGSPVDPGTVATMSVVHSQRESPTQESATRHLLSGKTYFASTHGWGVISDIDDTIKITEIRDRVKLLKHTFVDEFASPVPGMPQFYSALNQALNTQRNPATWMYLSASPYNLYPFLSGFVKDAGFPGGQMILRDMSWMDMESFIVSLTQGTQEYKTDRMRKIGSWLPEKTWVCIGDSTQTDPESYADFYNHLVQNGNGHNGRVARIYIHKVVGVNPDEEKDLNSPERFEKAFKDVPRDIWKVFETPEELYEELEVLKREVQESDPDPASN